MDASSRRSLLKGTLTIVLGGGQGDRLYPLTKDRAKPAVPFGGIYRIIDFTLSNCLNSGIRKIAVLTQYKSQSLERHLAQGWNVFHRELDEFIYTVPPQFRSSRDWYVGTADALYQNVSLLQRERPQRVLILSGDHVYKMDYGKMIAFHEENEADLTISAVAFEREKASSLGVVEVDGSSRVISFQEKPENPMGLPDDPTKSLVSMGIYVFRTEQLVRAVIEDAKTDSAHDFGKNVIPRMIHPKRVFAYRFQDENNAEVPYWRDIGEIDTYWEANMDLTRVSPVFNLYDTNWPIRTYQKQYPPAKTVFAKEGVRMGVAVDSMTSSGSIVSGARVERSILSPGVHVHSYAEVSESILMDRVQVGRHAKIRRAIVDKGVHVPDHFEIGYDLQHDRRLFAVSPGGIAVIPKGISLRSSSESSG
ncbi:MAG: glucose-1-phosphate adenylyltransferase [Candidatus Latescibacterota bacterium]